MTALIECHEPVQPGLLISIIAGPFLQSFFQAPFQKIVPGQHDRGIHGHVDDLAQLKGYSRPSCLNHTKTTSSGSPMILVREPV